MFSDYSYEMAGTDFRLNRLRISADDKVELDRSVIKRAPRVIVEPTSWRAWRRVQRTRGVEEDRMLNTLFVLNKGERCYVGSALNMLCAVRVEKIRFLLNTERCNTSFKLDCINFVSCIVFTSDIEF